MNVSTQLLDCVDAFIICVDVFTFLHQLSKFECWKLCRHIFQMSRPPWNFFSYCVNAHCMYVDLVFDKSSNCVDTCCMCVDLSLIILLAVSTHTSCVSTYSLIILQAVSTHIACVSTYLRNSSHYVDAYCTCVVLSVDFYFLSLSINLSITFIFSNL